MYSIKIPENENKSRLDRCIRRLIGEINQSILEKYLRNKSILLDNKKSSASQNVRTNQIISYSKNIEFNKRGDNKILDEKELDYYRGLSKKIVIEETKDWIALNKPNNIAVQGGTSQKFHLDNMIKFMCSNEEDDLKLVHRLDKDTSGLLLISKNQKSARQLSKLFKEGKIVKIYIALVSPSPVNNKGIVETKIAKLGNKLLKNMPINNKIGKTAKTEYHVLEKMQDQVAFVALYPITGRTHQLRLHMKHIGSPIIGDRKYFNEIRDQKFVKKTSKLKLHSLLLKLPKEKLLEAKMPQHFIEDLKFFGINTHKKEKIFQLFNKS